MKKTIAIITALFAVTAFAGEMRTNKDKFTSEERTFFLSTFQETKESKALVMMHKFSESEVKVSVTPLPQKVTDCKRNHLLLKDSTGKIHQIAANEVNNRICYFVISSELIANSFDIRLPLFREGNLDFSFSTVGLELDKLTK
jgi:hypothetical protein